MCVRTGVCMNPYEREFARFYDLIVFGREGVEAGDTEIEGIERIFEEFHRNNVKEVLDAGCGNGRFLIPLVRKGYTVTGMDISGDMLGECSRRLKSQHLKAELVQEDIEKMDYHAEFEAIICMDSVICYFLEHEKIVAVLKHFQRALRPHGVVVVENWNILAHWDLFGKKRWYEKASGNATVAWQEYTWYEPFASLYHGEVEATVLEGGNETHFRHEEVLRAMTAGEMVMYLKEAGFTHISVFPGLNPEEPKDEGLVFAGVSP